MPNANQRPWMIYGAYGFTGRLVAEEAVRRGHSPILAGRDAGRLAAVAGPLGLTARPLAIDDRNALADAVGSAGLVFNAAGPFAETAPAIIEACLEARTPYADISGELHHLRDVAGLDTRAQAAGVALMTGAGFGVTFGESLACHLLGRLPDATHLRLSVAADNAQTTGAVRRTILEVLAKGGYAVEGGRLVRRPLAHETWTVADDGQTLEFAAAPLGELAATQVSTGVANIVVGRPMPAKAAARIRRLSPLIGAALGFAPLRRALGRGGDRATPTVEGPRRSRIWAEARNDRGERVTARLETGEGYAASAQAALANVEAMLARPLAGAFTPGRAFGPTLLKALPDVKVVDLDPVSGQPLEAANA